MSSSEESKKLQRFRDACRVQTREIDRLNSVVLERNREIARLKQMCANMNKTVEDINRQLTFLKSRMDSEIDKQCQDIRSRLTEELKKKDDVIKRKETVINALTDESVCNGPIPLYRRARALFPRSRGLKGGRKPTHPDTILTKMIYGMSPITVSRNSYGNYEHPETNLVFDSTGRVCAKQVGDALTPLNLLDIENCNSLGFYYMSPFPVTGSIVSGPAGSLFTNEKVATIKWKPEMLPDITNISPAKEVEEEKVNEEKTTVKTEPEKTETSSNLVEEKTEPSSDNNNAGKEKLSVEPDTVVVDCVEDRVEIDVFADVDFDGEHRAASTVPVEAASTPDVSVPSAVTPSAKPEVKPTGWFSWW